MQKLAVLPFLAQPAQPMLAHQVIVVRARTRRRRVAVGTRRAQRAVAGEVCFTGGARGVDSKTVGTEEEGREGEGVGS